MSTLNAAISASASALAPSACASRSPSRTWPTRNRRAGPDGQPYRRRDVVLPPSRSRRSTRRWAAPRPPASRWRPSSRTRAPPRQRYEPSHPDADKEGYVALPNVDPAEEMVDMVSAARAYQANLTAINLIRDSSSGRSSSGADLIAAGAPMAYRGAGRQTLPRAAARERGPARPRGRRLRRRRWAASSRRSSRPTRQANRAVAR